MRLLLDRSNATYYDGLPSVLWFRESVKQETCMSTAASATKKKRLPAKESYIRDRINERVVQLGLTIHQFAHSGFVEAAPSTVYRFLNGEVETTSGNIDEMLTALNLTLRNGTRPVWAREAREERRARLAELGRDPANSIAGR